MEIWTRDSCSHSSLLTTKLISTPNINMMRCLSKPNFDGFCYRTNQPKQPTSLICIVGSFHIVYTLELCRDWSLTRPCFEWVSPPVYCNLGLMQLTQRMKMKSTQQMVTNSPGSEIRRNNEPNVKFWGTQDSSLPSSSSLAQCVSWISLSPPIHLPFAIIWY